MSMRYAWNEKLLKNIFDCISDSEDETKEQVRLLDIECSFAFPSYHPSYLDPATFAPPNNHASSSLRSISSIHNPMASFKLITHWCPSNILAPDFKGRQYCLILLNQPIMDLDQFRLLWAHASVRYCADGGANRLYDAFENDEKTRAMYIPDVVAGDLDSLRPDVRAFYEQKGVSVLGFDEQMTTDFEKCINVLKEREIKIDRVYDLVVTPTLGGRFDQVISNINVLYKMLPEVERRVLLVSNENLTVLLDKGTHHIHCQPDYEGPTCGIIPIGEPATITTQGLVWNLDKHKCFFGGMVSTSNSLDQDLIVIETDAPVLWTVEIKHGAK
ncbi:thiamine pyrophosphokinase [Dichotomocladium elegans]|nr:thiamine pyrophosphokinase [Dichotomocladium elegans]